MNPILIQPLSNMPQFSILCLHPENTTHIVICLTNIFHQQNNSKCYYYSFSNNAFKIITHRYSSCVSLGSLWIADINDGMLRLISFYSCNSNSR